MLLDKPRIPTVIVRVQDAHTGKSKSRRLYDTTPDEVLARLLKTARSSGEPKRQSMAKAPSA